MTDKFSISVTRSWALGLALIGVASWAAYAQGNGTFSLPNSVLLFSEPGPGVGLATETNVRVLKFPVRTGPMSHPNLAPDGSRVAVGVYSSDPPASRHFALGVLSVKQQEWKSYGDFEAIGVPAFSHDSRRVAFAASKGGMGRSLMILDLISGQITSIAQTATVVERADLGWSPDGQRLAIEMQHDDEPPAVAVLDLSTEKLNIIANGVDPTWSSTGEWIAYSDESRRKCTIIHPDGTGAKMVRDAGKDLWAYRLLDFGAVWSPDGAQLLLNEIIGEGPHSDVMLVDLGTGRTVMKSRNGPGVFAWAPEKP